MTLDLSDFRLWLTFFGVVIAVLGVIFLFVFLSFLHLWIQCVLTGADISIWNLIWMKLRKINYEMIVKQKIALVQTGVKVATAELEARRIPSNTREGEIRSASCGPSPSRRTR